MKFKSESIVIFYMWALFLIFMLGVISIQREHPGCAPTLTNTTSLNSNYEANATNETDNSELIIIFEPKYQDENGSTIYEPTTKARKLEDE